jgi:ATP-dependent DNA helicase HFM1/MER3
VSCTGSNADISFFSLYNNLIEHLNAEIGLGTVTGAASAKKWLSGTFLYVRLKENPDHYKIEGDASGLNLDERLERICRKGLASLEEHGLVSSAPKLRCTEFGDAMARYYLQFDTMKGLLALAPKAKISEILSVISKAAEFKDVRFRSGEKNMYKNLNKSGSIKFPILEDLNTSAHKVSLIIQSVLGAVDLPTEDQKHQWEYQSSKAVIFQHVHRLVRCIIDCQLYLEDSVASRNALMLARSLGAQVWDESPLHMKQLEGIGVVSVRKLVAAGISSIEELEMTEAHRIEQTLSRNPPYGLQVQDKAKAFPKLRVSVKMMGEPVIKKGDHVTIKIKAEIGFLNEKVPETFQKRAVNVCLLAENSQGHKVYFARISAKKLNKGQDLLFSANLTSASQSIRVYVMCDEVAGTMRHVVLKPDIPALAFPHPKAAEDVKQSTAPPTAETTSSTMRQASQTKGRQASIDSNEFNDDELDDADLARAETDGFVDIDDFEDNGELRGQPQKKKQKTKAAPVDQEGWEPKQLPNGKWDCKHTCTDKTVCRHLCCREGLDKKPKPPKQKENRKITDPGSDPKQTQLTMATAKKPNSTASKKTTSERVPPKPQSKSVDLSDTRSLNRLHDSVMAKNTTVPVVGQGRMDKDVGRSKLRPGQANLSFLTKTQDTAEAATSDYGMPNFGSDDLPEIEEIMGTQTVSRMSPRRNEDDSNFDFSMFDKMDTGIDFSDAANDITGQANMDPPPDAEDADFGRDNVNAKIIMHDDFGVHQQESSQPMQIVGVNPRKEKKLFVGHDTSDAVSSELPVVREVVGHKTRVTPALQMDDGKLFGQSGMTDRVNQQAPTYHSGTSAKPAVHNNSVPMIAESAKASIVNQRDDDVGSEDSVEKLVKGLLGTKDFNYIG